MKVKSAISSGNVGFATLDPTIGDVRSRMPWTRFSTIAWPREGTSWGRLMARRMAMISTSATTQLVTMLLVTGSGPTWNNASAAVDTPAASLAKTEGTEARARRKGARFVTRNMGAGSENEQGKGKEKGQPPT